MIIIFLVNLRNRHIRVTVNRMQTVMSRHVQFLTIIMVNQEDFRRVMIISIPVHHVK